MAFSESIGFIGGGRMAEALIQGILQAGLVTREQVVAADPDAGRRQFLEKTFGIATETAGASFLPRVSIIVLAVKPQVMGPVLDQLREGITSRHLVISIAAGIPLAFLEEKLAGCGCRLVRVMPNTPALVLEGAAAASGGRDATPSDLDAVQKIFSAVGRCVVVDEIYLDAVTGLSGSGPAYVFSFIEGLTDAGVKVGLARPVAEMLAAQTVLGAARMVLAGNDHPAALRAMVTSPGGTTIAGLHVMERAGFKGILMDTVEAATRRSMELGGKKQQ